MIYLDNAATTRMAQEVLEVMLPYFSEHFGNAQTMYALGAESRKAVMQAREQIAVSLGAAPEEIFFTSGGTESDNWALKSTAFALANKGRHIITSKIEHHAVLHTCAYLEREGFEVTYLDVDEYGQISPERLRAAIRPDTILISVMFANNEIGTLEPIAELGEIARERGILFHTDAVQAYGQLPISVDELPVDMLSSSAHKLNGPKGVGFLYIKKQIKLHSFLHGGAQERSRRAGTENVPGIVGFGAAAARAMRIMEEKIQKETALREYLIGRVTKEIAGCRLNGHPVERLPGNVHISFEGIPGDSLLILLDQKGICASGGSACTTGSVEPSHVLSAIGRGRKEARGSLRLTLSEENTKEEIDFVVDQLKLMVARLRSFQTGL